MTKKYIWRLKESPTSEKHRELFKAGLITKDETRQMLFSSETEEDRDKKSLESEIKFLRDLVASLSKNNNSRIVEIIREIEKPVYRPYPWWNQYSVWCGSVDTSSTGIGGDTTVSTDGAVTNTAASYQNFSDIKTF